MSENNGDEREIGGEPGVDPGSVPGVGPVADGGSDGGGGRPGLEALLQAREDACRALELGEDEIEYRGCWIGIEDNEGGWEYVFNGNSEGPLEDIFEEIDEL